MTRTKIDIKPGDRELLDELAETIGISRTEANSLIIRKCGKHLIHWLSQDFCQVPTLPTPTQPLSYTTAPVMTATNLNEPIDL